MQPNDVGTQRDLVLYRIEAAKEDLKSAKILRDADSYKGANICEDRDFSKRNGKKNCRCRRNNGSCWSKISHH